MRHFPDLSRRSNPECKTGEHGTGDHDKEEWEVTSVMIEQEAGKPSPKCASEPVDKIERAEDPSVSGPLKEICNDQRRES